MHKTTLAMDDLLFRSVVLAVLAVALLQLVKLALKPRSRTPPGPWRLPVIGSIHHLAMAKVLPHRALSDLAAVHGPLMMLQLGQTQLVVASTRELARDLLRTHELKFIERPKLFAGEIVAYGCSDILFSPTGDYWRKLRRLCTTEILNPKRVLSFRRVREEEVAARVKKIREAGPSTPVDLSAMFHDLFNSILSRAVLGSKWDFQSALEVTASLASGFNAPDLFPAWAAVLARVTGMDRRLQEIHKTIDSMQDEIIAERKAVRAEKKMKSGAADDNAENSFVDQLISLQEKGGLDFELTDTRIKAIILDMFAGGLGSPTATLEWAMSELIRHPSVMKKLQGKVRDAFRGKASLTESDLRSSNLQYPGLVIKETLRLHPPSPLLIPRVSTAACEVGGYTIPVKSRVAVNQWAIGRDPRYWEDAEEFKPERFEDGRIDFLGSSFEFIPFGAGRRICPGINFSVAMMEITLISMIYNFDWSLPEGVMELDMEERGGIGVRRRSPLKLCAIPFVPAAISSN